MRGDRVVNERFHPGLRQSLSQPIPLRRSRHQQVGGGFRVRQKVDPDQRSFRQQLAIERGEGSPPRVPSGKVRELGPQYRRLELVQATVEADLPMDVAIFLSAVSQPSQTIRHGCVVGCDHSSVPQRTEILSGIKTEAARFAPTSERTIRQLGAVCLAGVFNDRKTVLPGEPQESRHLARVPVEMHRKECLGTRSHPFRHRLGREIQAPPIYSGEGGSCPGSADGEGGEGSGQGSGNDLVARTDAQRPKGKREGIGPRGYPDGMGRPHHRCELLLEGFHFGAQNEPSALHDPPHRIPDLCRPALVLGGQADKRDGWLGHLSKIMIDVPSIVFDGSGKTLAKAHLRLPAELLVDLAVVVIEVAYVDTLAVFRKRDFPEAASSARHIEQRLYELEQRYRRARPQVVDLPHRLIRDGDPQEGIYHVVDVIEVSLLGPVAEELDLLSPNRLPDEPTRESLPVVLDQLSRTVGIGQAK